MKFAKEGICPICGSEDIEYQEIEIDFPTGVYFPCVCNKCQATFNEWYNVEFHGQYDISEKNVLYTGEKNLLAEQQKNA